MPGAVSQNFFGMDASEISSQSVPSQSETMSPEVKGRRKRIRAKPVAEPEEEVERLPEKLKEEDLRPEDRPNDSPFEMFWQVIRKQEEPPY